MTGFFVTVLFGLLAVVFAMLVFLLGKRSFNDKLNAVFYMNTAIVMLIMIIGFIDGRMDMYIDIALSYAVLGFVTTVILAKFIGGKRV